MFTQILAYFLLFINPFIVPSAPPKPSEIKDDGIIWQEKRRLTWNDFQSEVDSNDPLHAITSTNINVQANCYGNFLKYDVKCVFVTKESWSKNKISKRLLTHEQMHFDLTEVHARLLRQKLSQLKDFCGSRRTGLDKLVDQAFADWKKEQDFYDQESEHGLNKEKQAMWEASISRRLDELAAFAY